MNLNKKTDVNQGVDKNKDQDFSVSINQFSFVPNQLKVMVNGREVIINGNKQEYMFVDIFNFIDFDLSKPQGSIVLKLNGKQAAFTDIIKPGDEIEIGWE